MADVLATGLAGVRLDEADKSADPNRLGVVWLNVRISERVRLEGENGLRQPMRSAYTVMTTFPLACPCSR
jgi:hypothetical protein